MCFGGSKTTTNNNSATNTATTADTSGTSSSAPTNPYIDPAVSGLVQAATTQAQTPLSLYQGNMVAPLTANQNTAIDQINGASGLAQPYLASAAQYAQKGAAPITSTPFSQQNLQQYYSPYQNDVLNSTMALQNQQDQQQQQSLAGNITAAGAWGGDRSGVVQSELAGQQKLANNATNAGLENQGYQTALGQFNTTNQQNLQTQQANNANNENTAYTLGNLGTSMENSALTGANALFNAGTAQQQINQENLNVPYEQYLQQQAYPYQNLDFLSSILSGAAGTTGTTTNQTGSAAGTNIGNTTGAQQQSQSSPIGNQLLGGALSLASMFLKDGGRTKLADGGETRLTIADVPKISGYIPTISNAGRSGLAAPGLQSLGNAAPASAAAPSFGSALSNSGSSDNGFSQGQSMGTSLGGIGQSLFGDPTPQMVQAPNIIPSNPLSGLGGIADSVMGMSLKTGGRSRLADGGADDYGYADQPYVDPAADVDQVPAGATAMTLADTPMEWRGKATNFAPETPVAPQGASLAGNTDTDYTPPPDLGGSGLLPDASTPPTWDDGTPITTGGDPSSGISASGWGGSLAHPAQIVQQAYQAKPDWRRALMTAGAAMMAAHSGNGLTNVGEGLQAGVRNYYDQLDKDNHPEVDHSGPTTTVRYADGTVVDTGIPTEAAINAKASNDYKISNAQQMSADRQARIEEQRQAAKDRTDQMRQATEDRALYQRGLLALGSQRADAGQYAGMQPGKGIDANGNPVDGVYSLDKRTGKPLFTPGAVLDPKGAGAGGMQGGREGVMFNRVVSAGNSAAAAAANIMELPSDTNTGWFAGRHQGPGLLGATKESLTNTLTSQDVQDYNSMVPGVTRNLGALETQGLAVPGSMTHSMDGVLLKQGDTEVTKLRKMAEMRQIIETNLEPQLSNPRVPPEQKQLVQKIIGQIQQTIPFTHHDITQLEKSGAGTSLASVAGKRGLGGGQQPVPSGAKFQEGQVLHQNGNLYKVTNGVPVYQGAAP